MKKNLFKIISLFLICITCISVLSYANSDSWSIDVDKTFDSSNADNNIGLDYAEDNVTKIIGNCISIVQVIGVGVAVILLISLGIKYMISSVEEKAKVKEHAVIYVIGAIVFFSAAGILQIIQIFIEENFVV